MEEKAFRIGMGPFALMNLTGPPIALHSTDYLAEQLETPRYVGAENLREMVAAGNQWDIGEDTDCSEEAAEAIRVRLLGQVFAVAGQIVDEEAFVSSGCYGLVEEGWHRVFSRLHKSQ